MTSGNINIDTDVKGYDTPQDRRLRKYLVNLLGDAHVGEQHEFFHQTIRLSQLLLLNVDGIRRLGRSKMDFHFGRCEIQRAGGHTLCLELDRERIEKADRLRERVGAIADCDPDERYTVDPRHNSRVVLAHLCLLVLECRFRSDHRLCELDVDNVSVLGELLTRC